MTPESRSRGSRRVECALVVSFVADPATRHATVGRGSRCKKANSCARLPVHFLQWLPSCRGAGSATAGGSLRWSYSWPDEKVLLGQLAQDEVLDSLQVKQPVLRGGGDRLQQGSAGIILDRAQQAAQRQSGSPGVMLFPSFQVSNDLGDLLAQPDFFRGAIRGLGLQCLPARSMMFGQAIPTARGFEDAP